MTQDQRRKTIITAGASVIVSLLLTIIIGATFTTLQIRKTNDRADHEIEISNQRWCTLFEDIGRPRPKPPVNPAAPPTSPFGKELLRYNKAMDAANQKFLREVLDLARSARCPFVR